MGQKQKRGLTTQTLLARLIGLDALAPDPVQAQSRPRLGRCE